MKLTRHRSKWWSAALRVECYERQWRKFTNQFPTKWAFATCISQHTIESQTTFSAQARQQEVFENCQLWSISYWCVQKSIPRSFSCSWNRYLLGHQLHVPDSPLQQRVRTSTTQDFEAIKRHRWWCGSTQTWYSHDWSLAKITNCIWETFYLWAGLFGCSSHRRHLLSREL